MTRTTSNIVDQLGAPPAIQELPAPGYTPTAHLPNSRVALTVASMRNHTSDEGWQLMQGLQYGGYLLAGYGVETVRRYGDCEFLDDLVSVPKILDWCNPSVVVVQDKREWEGRTADRIPDPRVRFSNIEALRTRPDVFKLTVLKDAHQQPSYHRDSADEMGCHAWIVYYHPGIVKHLAPYVRPKHLIRTYHSIDSDIVPIFTPEGRSGCLLSGAMNRTVYPLRSRLYNDRHSIPDLTWQRHPGYHSRGSDTPAYLKTLSRFKVAICTSSIYGYAVRKIVEATACGCRVITDLPSDDVLPEIDGNLTRVPSTIPTSEMNSLIRSLIATYDDTTQYGYVFCTKRYYDYRILGKKLAGDIEAIHRSYTNPNRSPC